MALGLIAFLAFNNPDHPQERRLKYNIDRSSRARIFWKQERR